jgi:hypothetical protein
VTLETLFVICAVLVAVLTMMRPIQRHSIFLFVPLRWMAVALVACFALIVCRDAPFGVKPPFGWPLEKVVFFITLAAFMIPVGAAIWAWVCWHRAKLTGKKIIGVEELFKASLREKEFDEVQRILSKNKRELRRLPAGAASVLFDSAMVAALIEGRSLIHLELLSDTAFLEALDNRFAAVDVVVRKLLRSEISPLRSAVVKIYGGLEHAAYPEEEQKLMEGTFQNPSWYVKAFAHYPLVISTVEELRSGELDSEYNGIGRDYAASQGISRRAYCPVYLAVKTEVLAIEAAIEHRSEDDLYVSDLSDAFRAILERSEFKPGLWEGDLANPEFPTPYAYLLYEIGSDFRDLSAKAVQEATSKNNGARQIQTPGRIAHDLAKNWCFFVWSIAEPMTTGVSDRFRDATIQSYVVFILQLGWAPSEIYHGHVDEIKGLALWRDMFTEELKGWFRGDADRRVVLVSVVQSLDKGKGYVTDGYDWLCDQLGQ